MEVAGWQQLQCVERKGEMEVGSGGVNRLYVHKRDIPRNKKTTNIIIIVLSENDSTSKWSTFFWYCWTFPSNTENITRQPTRVTARVYTKRYTGTLQVVHIRFIYWDNWFSLYHFPYLFCYIINAIGVMID